MDVAPVDGLTRTECAALAQVHATLAQAAAIGTLEPDGSRWETDSEAWLDATGAKG